VQFDNAMPKWKRRQKLAGFGRTYWRVLLG
jgi:hypothetical protein